MESNKTFTVGKYRVFTVVDFCTDMENPLDEQDGLGQIFSFSTRHYNGPHSKEYKQAESDGKFDLKYRVPLSYWEHGKCRWFVQNGSSGGMSPYDFRWDGVSYAGLWIPDNVCTQMIMKKRRVVEREALAKELAASACETYTSWCNGDVYCWRYEIYENREPYDRVDDYRFDESLDADSCCGYFGDDIKNGIADMQFQIREFFKSEGIEEVDFE